jgi:hypothetical protein
MKRLCQSILVVGLFAFSASSHATTPSVFGNIQPASGERISVLVGDKAKITLGTREGLIKGDVGQVSPDRDLTSEKTIGQCAVTATGFDTSVCEIIKGKREIEKGDLIGFQSVTFTDPNFYSLVMNTLADIVDPYEPYRDINVCVYGIFDKSNSLTALSKELKTEFERIIAQKRRLHLVPSDSFHDLILYPSAPAELLAYVKTQMKRLNVDALILGSYTMNEGKVRATIQKIDLAGSDNTITYALPVQSRYTDLSSKILLTPGQLTRARNINCSLSLKSLPRVLSREERLSLIKSESAGNALTEQALRTIDFNVVNPIEIRATVDGETIDLSDKKTHSLLLSTGNHSVSIALKRGYFYNDTLLYTSESVVRKEATLDLNTGDDLNIEVSFNTLQLKDPISLLVFHSVQRQHQVLTPIRRIESERMVEVFKD